MGVALVLTLLALASVAAGVLLGQSTEFSSHLSAAGGGLLFGIALFWLAPEIAENSNWSIAVVLAGAACGIIALLDRLLIHAGHSPRQGVVGPVLIATAVHSLLDGWSVRAFSGQRLTAVAVPLGLALHKVPEGLAVGWLSRRAMSSISKAIIASMAVEAVTIVGAAIEPSANSEGMLNFGASWATLVLAIIAGSFLYLGFHAVLPARRRIGVVAVFFVTLFAVAGTSMLKH